MAGNQQGPSRCQTDRRVSPSPLPRHCHGAIAAPYGFGGTFAQPSSPKALRCGSPADDVEVAVPLAAPFGPATAPTFGCKLRPRSRPARRPIKDHPLSASPLNDANLMAGLHAGERVDAIPTEQGGGVESL